MINPKEILANLSVSRILDVATGRGDFINFLLEGLPDYREIIGIDINNDGQAAFDSAFSQKRDIHFQVMDALHMSFEPSSFDLVCISNSLHHLDQPQAVLQEMDRVLRPGGYFLLHEMYRDMQAETQISHVELHHWRAAIDRVRGIVHNETYNREDLTAMLANLGLSEIRSYDLSDIDGDPRRPGFLERLNTIIDQSIQLAEGYPDLQIRGEQIRKLVNEVGFHNASSLLMMGKKRD